MVGAVSNTNWPVPVAPVDVTPSMVGWPVSVKLLTVGEALNTKLPVPVAPVDVTPSMVGWPVMVGEALNTKLPVPVLAVIDVPRNVIPVVIVGDAIEGLVANTAVLPDPVLAVIAVPAILNELPAPAVSNVLWVNVLVDESVIRVPEASGRVMVAVAPSVACNCVIPVVAPLKAAYPVILG